SLVQAIGQLDDDCELVALLDADCVPHASWLRELAAPFADADVAVAYGNRWYMPPDARCGSLMRYIWNVGAVGHMIWCGIPWGGTLALRRTFLDEADLAGAWSSAFCEDTMLARAAQRRGRRCVFVPSLLMVNRETCTVGSLLPWIRRQLLTVRLYHGAWPTTLAYGLASPTIVLAALAAIAWSLCLASEPSQLAALATLAVLAGLMTLRLAIVAALEITARGVIAKRGEQLERTSWRRCAAMPFLLAVTPFYYLAALLRAQWMRHVVWRGVQYRVDSAGKIQRLDHPAWSGSEQSESRHSL
ncbi:MAG: glycosyltransferase family 2 protein, partial [Planctomycetales bacterium]|nr:glycosyltransferase family 2 protein [Planctomycetales bacterium]